jgi:hypothetical protein
MQKGKGRVACAFDSAASSNQARCGAFKKRTHPAEEILCNEKDSLAFWFY